MCDNVSKIFIDLFTLISIKITALALTIERDFLIDIFFAIIIVSFML